MIDLEKKFADFLDREQLFDKKILLNVSGGVDSMVLAHIAQKICGKNIAIFHLHHGVRSEAHEEVDLVSSFCGRHELQFYGEYLHTKSEKNRENFWREARQKLSQKCADDFGAQRILTAHHATDLAETMIFRLTKGCGLHGLSPFDISTKPFWDTPKQTLIEYAQNNDIPWKEDESNMDDSFQRNLIRNKVLPELRKITPNLEKVFVSESLFFKKSADFLEDYCQNKIENRNSIMLEEFLNFSEIVQATILRILSKTTPSSSEINDCQKWLLNSPKGNSKKKIGHTQLWIQNNALHWQ